MSHLGQTFGQPAGRTAADEAPIPRRLPANRPTPAALASHPAQQPASRTRFGAVLAVSILLHLLAWQGRHWLQQPPETLPVPRPPVTVTLVPATQPAAAPGPAAPAPPAPPVIPRPVTPPAAPPARPAPPKVTKPPVPPKPRPRVAPEPDPNAAAPARPVPRRLPAPEPATSAAPAAPARAPASHAPPGAASTAPAAPRAPAAGPAGGAFESARAHAAYLHNPKPVYPPLAKRRQWEGKVLLRVQVLASGAVAAVSVAAGSGHEVLDEAALEAVRQWHFVPAKRGGQAVDSWVNVPINFNLLEAP